MENQPPEQTQDRKIYSEYSIAIATFLGGPMTTGYLLAENFKTLGYKTKVTLTWIIATIVTVALLSGIIYTPNLGKVSNRLIPVIEGMVAYLVVSAVQGKDIKAYLTRAGKAYSYWRALGISLIGAIVTLVPAALVVSFFWDTGLPKTSKSYGPQEHLIFFDRGNVSETEVDKIASSLTEAEFFGEYRKEIAVEKKDGKYIISIPLNEGEWNDPEFVDYYGWVREDVQKSIIDHKVVVNLCSRDAINQIEKVLE